ncbi:MAG TPA: SDR family oxidoreductase [Humibacter sp.]|nr:SDR family oxidoreductase [Humibacter sp.]
MTSTSLVIGGTSGIGLATAVRLAAVGDSVHVAGRGAERVAAATGEHPELVGHVLDANDRRALDSVLAELGTLDRLVVTVASSAGAGAFSTLDVDVLRSAFDAKYWPTVTSIQAAIPHLAEEGSITLIGAITARMGMNETAGIGSLNAAVEGLVRPLATELAPIRVNAVSPGGVDTPWWDFMPAELRAQLFAQTAATLAVRHVATADEVAEAVVFAATNRNLTGTVIETDGGARLGPVAA